MDLSPPFDRSPLQIALRLTWPFLATVLVLAACAAVSLHVLSAARAFVAGESLWTKGQKDAIHYLGRYAESASPQDFDGFTKALDIPLGDQAARLALQPGQIHMDAAQKGFVRGGNHPEDVDSLLWLLRYFHQFDLVRKPVHEWVVADTYIQRLRDLSAEIRQRHAAGPVDAETRAQWQQSIDSINTGVTPVARAFSDALGDSSRRIVVLLVWANAGIAVALILLTLWHTRALLAQRQRVERTLDVERERARTTLAAIGDAVITTDAGGAVVYANPAAESLLGCSAPHLVGQPLEAVLHLKPHGNAPQAQELAQVILESANQNETGAHGLNRIIVRPDQTLVPVKLMASAIEHLGAATGAVFVLHDVTREQHYVEQLSWQASHDALTGLVNRREFEHRLDALLSSSRQPGREGSLLYLDMDQFKLINDTCGHQAGDQMLREVCRVLQQHLREGDTLARLGGDEFGILLRDCPAEPSALIAEQLRRAAEELRLHWEGQSLSTGLSIGMVQLMPVLNSVQEAMRVADMACYRAKEGGRNRVFIYEPKDTEMARREGDMDWVRRLRLALEENQFRLFAQTIAPLQAPASAGLHLEVLLRLCGEDGDLVPPGSFIPAAEHYGMMPAIDRWVILSTLQRLAQHQRTAGLQSIVTCAINLSGTSLGDDTLLKFIRSAIAETGADPCTLCFEITETSAISHPPNAVRLMTELQQLGCRFALDDFGTGMSSFHYLKHLPVHYLKIDGAFVKDMLLSPTNRAMVEMIHHMGQVMGKQTIAEFAESDAIVDALRTIGVHYAQGYALSRPVPLQDFLNST